MVVHQNRVRSPPYFFIAHQICFYWSRKKIRPKAPTTSPWKFTQEWPESPRKIPRSHEIYDPESWNPVRNHLNRVQTASIFFYCTSNMFLLIQNKYQIQSSNHLSVKIHPRVTGQFVFDKKSSKIQISHTIQSQNPDFRSTLPGCNFAHTCRRLKSSGVFKSRFSNSFISGVLRPIRLDWVTPGGDHFSDFSKKWGSPTFTVPVIRVFD